MTKIMNEKDKGYFLGAYTTLTGLDFVLGTPEMTLEGARRIIATTIDALRNDPDFAQVDTRSADTLTSLADRARQEGVEEEFFEMLGENVDGR